MTLKVPINSLSLSNISIVVVSGLNKIRGSIRSPEGVLLAPCMPNTIDSDPSTILSLKIKTLVQTLDRVGEKKNLAWDAM